jgi:hypothetical protein
MPKSEKNLPLFAWAEQQSKQQTGDWEERQNQKLGELLNSEGQLIDFIVPDEKSLDQEGRVPTDALQAITVFHSTHFVYFGPNNKYAILCFSDGKYGLALSTNLTPETKLKRIRVRQIELADLPEDVMNEVAKKLSNKKRK